MTDTPDYSLATNMAYRTLITFHEFSFPISIFSVLRAMGNIVVNSYSEVAQRFNITFNEFYELASSDYGFTIRDFKNDRYEVYYNDRKCDTTIRFTLAHELGHIVLKHHKDGDKEDKEANCFARNYLCPIPAAMEMKLETIKDYIDCFFVSEPMAEVSMNFRKRDYTNISNFNYNKYNNSVICEMTGMTLNELYGYYS